MTENTTQSETDTRRTSAVLRAAVAMMLLVSIMGVGFAATSGVAAAANNTTNVSDKAPYYEDQNSSDVDIGAWMQDRETPTLENIVGYAGRFGSFVIGSPQGSYADGRLFLGVILAGAMMGITIGAGIGIVGGGVIAVSSIAALASINAAPDWLYAVVLFGLGLMLSAVAKRQLR